MNQILINAKYHTENPKGKEMPIICTKEELDEVSHLFNPEVRKYLSFVLDQMEAGIEFVFWYTESGHLYCEG